MQWPEFVVEHIIFNIGEKEPDLGRGLEFIRNLKKIVLDKFKPKLGLFLGLLLALLEGFPNKFSPDPTTHTKFSRFITILNMQTQNTLQKSQIGWIFPVVCQPNTTIVVGQILVGCHERFIVSGKQLDLVFGLKMAPGEGDDHQPHTPQN